MIQRLTTLTSPTTEWGPALVKYRKLVHYVPGFVTDPWGTGTKKEPVDYDNMAVCIKGDLWGEKVASIKNTSLITCKVCTQRIKGTKLV